MNALIKLGIVFFPFFPYSPQENREEECLNRMLGDMARAMMVQSGMPARFWKFEYSSAAFLDNHTSKSRRINSSPQELFRTAPSITALYPFGEDAIVHIPAVNQLHKLGSRGIECKLLKPLMTGGWLLWEPSTNKMVQSASVVFPQFQLLAVLSGPVAKGSLAHAFNTMFLGEVPMENQAIDSLILIKDVSIPKNCLALTARNGDRHV
ncbi:hypothetical protein O181_024129 [Austropuccinia psidii MF-1]|uniref:Retroviral polymerase SH3-like domain-containing protein n=1 Tax=Austropuccinia psidii MF-1 TaxID=1389203 RepID=A0A9Q3CI19_9BASI|nr:hypothetical protein [Austropuccinia psidii MF-1]